ncbi:MAG: polyamine ABC transporter ATP-binding protein [Thermodesulfatator sp.]|nr:MAG: polyamine ABC transporter ATP-binding protein [Thermodesulfatator sp.]
MCPDRNIADKRQPHIRVVDLTMAYGDFVIQRNLNFTIYRGDIFIVMGVSGCGKSTLLKHLTGLMRPASGRILFGDVDFWAVPEYRRWELMERCGVSYQDGALWSSMTLSENISLPLEQYTSLSPGHIRRLASLKLSLVGLKGFDDFFPAQISGGMRKRAGLARAMALDPEVLFFDEPSAGLDPVSSKRLDDLILEIRDSLGATIVVITHELASIFSIGSNGVFLDNKTKTMLAAGHPRDILRTSKNQRVIDFLTRGTGKRELPCV